MKHQKKSVLRRIWSALFLLGVLSQLLLNLFQLAWAPSIGNVWYCLLLLGIVGIVLELLIKSMKQSLTAYFIETLAVIAALWLISILGVFGTLFLSPSVAIDYKMENHRLIVEPILAPANWRDSYKVYNDVIISNKRERIYVDF